MPRISRLRQSRGHAAPSLTVTQLLQAWRAGDDAAIDQLMPLVEKELHRVARAHMGRERKGHTLQATALVNEVFLRLPDARRLVWQDRAHFVGIAAHLMRRVLVDHARARGARKRGDDFKHVPIDEAMETPVTEPEFDVVALDRVLDAFAAVDPRKSRVVELRFFGGLSVEETADVLHVSADTIKRDWRLAKLWLRRELERELK
jgi:RNA polymerase sigma-70 factor (ECF subfamily)